MALGAIDKLIAADRESPKRIAVIGDAMTDVYVHGRIEIGQEGCPKFVERQRIECLGGAANAAVSIGHWKAPTAWFSAGNIEPTKTRFLVDGIIVFRYDNDETDCEAVLAEKRKTHLQSIVNGKPDAILISDYDKGFLSPEFIRQIIDYGNERGIPVVADAKREPDLYAGAILKCNHAYTEVNNRWKRICNRRFVITYSSDVPFVNDPVAKTFVAANSGKLRDVQCISHVGAGDCFAAHLVLALAHGLPIEDAAAIAHSAGRVYVQHLHNRAPWPHEIRKDLDPVGGKVLCKSLPALRESIAGRIVFTNGCFDVFGPQHLYLLQEAKKLGDILIVGLNSDESVSRLKGASRPIIPQEQRAMLIAGMECVDWVFIFDGDAPVAELEELRPDVRVRGKAKTENPAGDEFAKETIRIPLMEGWSTTNLLNRINRNT